jgi:hypothetical protein
MRKMVPVALIALALSAFPGARLAAWGFNGHKFITDRAIDLLPPEIRPFYQKYRTTIVEHAIDPDTYRTMGWTEEPPRHFVDMDAYGPFPFKELPHDYKAAVAARGADFVVKNGVVPWRAQEIYDQLKTAFSQIATTAYARDNVLLLSAVISHYTADSYQPFHAVTNYDGQLTGQNGIHARFETELFDRYRDKLTLAPPPLKPIPCAPSPCTTTAREFLFATLTDSFTFAAPILAADREATQGREFYDDAYFAKLYEKTGPILEKRIGGAISGVASIITQAWVDAGKPALPLDPAARQPRPIRRDR